MLFLPLGFGFFKFSLMLSKTRLTRYLSGNESVMKENKESKREIDVAWNPSWSEASEEGEAKM